MNGAQAHPLYVYMKSKQGGGILGSAIKWNFTKFLIDRTGVPIKRWGPLDNPNVSCRTEL